MHPAVSERDWLTPRRLAGLLAVLTGAGVFLIAHEVFPYHTSNHDEGVYLQQAAMLLEGKLTLEPPVPESFRPWFFVVDGESMYPKYSPVTAATFAVGKLLGGFRIALGLVAAAVVGLTYALVTEVFDDRTGLVAALLTVGSPIFVVEASVFLPYVPTLAWNLLFGWAYLRADRTGDRRLAALSGLAIGVAFFARPYTAVLFAAPFVAHALWTLRGLDRDVFARQLLTAGIGACGVAVTLGYNAVVTGSPFLFPYEAFAPLDGPGFGYREIAGYGRVYTIELALEANARLLWGYATTWSVAPPAGVLLALGGLGAVLRRLPDRVDPRKLVVAGLAVSIPLGQLYFWGTLNVLGSLSDPTDGLVSFLGPYYYLGLLVPTVAFGAHGLVLGWKRLEAFRRRSESRQLARGVLVCVAVLGLVSAAVGVGAVNAPLARNAEVTEQYEQAYEPFETQEFDDALVLLPTPYGDWLNHPFQVLRNDPGYDGDVVYTIQHRQFDVIDAFPDRQLYRYTYRGDWSPYAGRTVEPRLRQIQTVEGTDVGLDVSVGVPRFTRRVDLRASTTENGYALAGSPGDRLNLTVQFVGGQAIVRSPSFREPVLLPVEDRETLDLQLFVDDGTTDSFSYDLAVPVEYQNGTYRVLSPRLEVCRAPIQCDGEAAYVPGAHREGVEMSVTLRENR